MSALRRLAREVWLPRLTRRGVGFLIIGSGVFLAALFLDRRDLIFVGALLVAMPITAACYVGFRQVKVQVSRTFRPAVVSAGNSLRVAVQVRNRAFRPLYGVRWSESTSAGLSVPGAAALPALARSSGARGSRADRVVLDYRLTPTCRGLYDLGPLVLHTYDPFGLAYGRRLGGTVADLIVTPPVTALPGLGLGVAGGEGNARELLHHHNPHSDELIAREYRPGDPLRRVNWPATARHGEIMVRQEEQRSIPSARLVLDTTMSGVPDHDSLAGSDWFSRHDDAFETAIELTASIGAHLIDAGFRVAVSELGASQLAPGPGPKPAVYGGTPRPFFFRRVEAASFSKAWLASCRFCAAHCGRRASPGGRRG